MLRCAQLKRKVSAAATAFGPGCKAFLSLKAKFSALLRRRTLHGSQAWLDKARLWRFALLQDPQGFFDPTDSLAFALMAITREQSNDRRLQSAISRGAAPVMPGGGALDCPLTYSAEAIRQTVPEALLRAAGVLSGDATDLGGLGFIRSGLQSEPPPALVRLQSINLPREMRGMLNGSMRGSFKGVNASFRGGSMRGGTQRLGSIRIGERAAATFGGGAAGGGGTGGGSPADDWYGIGDGISEQWEEVRMSPRSLSLTQFAMADDSDGLSS